MDRFDLHIEIVPLPFEAMASQAKGESSAAIRERVIKARKMAKPKYFIHGHVHMNYGRKHVRHDKYMDTQIINAYEKYVFEYEE